MIRRCAVLGYGTIGALLTGLLAERGSAGITVANRSPGRMDGRLPPGAAPAASFADAVKGAGLVFLCVKPQACAEVLRSVSNAATDDTLLVSTAGDVSLALLQGLWPGPVVRLMPTVTAQMGRGVNLLCGRPEDSARAREAFPSVLKFLEVPEDRWNAVAAATSCGPGLVSALLSTWGRDVAARTGLSTEEADALVAETVAAALALGDLKGLGFPAVLGAVASPGGVTGEGARVLGERMPMVWSEVDHAMEGRHRTREEEVRRTFADSPLPSPSC